MFYFSINPFQILFLFYLMPWWRSFRAAVLSGGISTGSVIIFRPLPFVFFSSPAHLLEDVIAGDSPSAVVHVTGPCGGCTFHCKTHHGRPASRTVVTLFMIKEYIIYLHCPSSLSLYRWHGREPCEGDNGRYISSLDVGCVTQLLWLVPPAATEGTDPGVMDEMVIATPCHLVVMPLVP